MERGRDKREIVLYWQQLSNDEEEIFLDSTDNRKCSPKLPMKKNGAQRSIHVSVLAVFIFRGTCEENNGEGIDFKWMMHLISYVIF